MVELKCRAELAVTGRSACRNADCEHSKERGGRIPHGKLRWGIGGPGGHSMKWYCIRPICLPADQVKDMLVPEKCENAADMDGVSELPDGFREATINCLEAIRDDRVDQLDEAVLAKLDEVGPLTATTPRVAPRLPVETTPPAISSGRQGLRSVRQQRIRENISALGDEGDGDEDSDSDDDEPGGIGSGGGMAQSSLPARTVDPPALLIPGRRGSGRGGSDSPILAPPLKTPRLDEDIGGGDVLGANTSGAMPISLSSHYLPVGPAGSADESYSALGLGLYPGSSSLGTASSMENPSVPDVVESGIALGAATGRSPTSVVGATTVAVGGGTTPASTGGKSELGGAEGFSHTSGMIAGSGMEGGDSGARGGGTASESLEEGGGSGPHGGIGGGITQGTVPTVGATGFSAPSLGSALSPGLSSYSVASSSYVGSAAVGLDPLAPSSDAIAGSLLEGGADVGDSALQDISDEIIGEHGPHISTSMSFTGSSLLSGGEVIGSAGADPSVVSSSAGAAASIEAGTAETLKVASAATPGASSSSAPPEDREGDGGAGTGGTSGTSGAGTGTGTGTATGTGMGTGLDGDLQSI